MFRVRSSRTKHGPTHHLPPPGSQGRTSTPAPYGHDALLSMSAAREVIQSAAGLGHLPRHEHAINVTIALIYAHAATLNLGTQFLRRRRPPRAAHTLPRISYGVCFSTTRQDTFEFNQPLSWDTSSVTNMRDMFSVRFARPTPNLN